MKLKREKKILKDKFNTINILKKTLTVNLQDKNGMMSLKTASVGKSIQEHVAHIFCKQKRYAINI